MNSTHLYNISMVALMLFFLGLFLWGNDLDGKTYLIKGVAWVNEYGVMVVDAEQITVDGKIKKPSVVKVICENPKQYCNKRIVVTAVHTNKKAITGPYQATAIVVLE